MSPTTIHVAEAHLKEERKRELCEVAPLFPELRELLLKKCAPQGIERVRAVIERQSFGELERLVAQTLLHVAQLRRGRAARDAEAARPARCRDRVVGM